jgi:hypothetical protein
MKHNGSCGQESGPTVSRADLKEELHRLRESKMLLVLMAEKAGLAIPRSCCPHRGERACASCSSDWLVARVRLSSAAVH